MNFAETRWVKLFTQDSITWKSWPWQTRTIFLHVLRKVDRRGRLEVGKDPIRGLRVLLDLPGDLVEAGYPSLIAADDGEDPTIREDGRFIVLVKFEQAQSSPQSDALRARQYRERIATPSQDVTDESRIVMAESRNVMRSSRGVTGRHASVPTEQNREKEEKRENGETPLASLVPPQAGVHVRKRSESGTRLNETWEPNDTSRKVCSSLGLSIAHELAQFRGYWCTLPGTRAKKLDWDLTFQVRLREQAGRRGGNGRPALVVTANPNHRPFVPPPLDLPAMNAADAESQVELWMNGRGKH